MMTNEAFICIWIFAAEKKRNTFTARVFFSLFFFFFICFVSCRYAICIACNSNCVMICWPHVDHSTITHRFATGILTTRNTYTELVQLQCYRIKQHQLSVSINMRKWCKTNAIDCIGANVKRATKQGRGEWQTISMFVCLWPHAKPP